MDKNPTDDFDLDDILNEFAPAERETPPETPAKPRARRRLPREQAASPRPGSKDPRKNPAQEAEEPTLRLVTRGGKPVEDADLSAQTRRVPSVPAETAPDEAAPKERRPFWRRKKTPKAEEAAPADEQVIPFPQEPPKGRFERLKERGDRYAERMFQGDEEDPEEAERERLLPGVDYEDEPTHAPPQRKARRRKSQPDIPPDKLAKTYKNRLAFLHTRVFLAFFLALPQVYLMVAQGLELPVPPLFAASFTLRYQTASLCMGVSGLLAVDILAQGVWHLFTLHLEADTLLFFAFAATLADALTMSSLDNRNYAMPYCGVISVMLAFALWGKLKKLRGLRQSCRVAASSAEPYLVTLEEQAWNGTDAYMKSSGSTKGYGSQIQEPDGVQRAYHIAAPLLLLSALLLSLLASVGRERPELLFWCLSATLTSACGIAGFLPYALPYDALARRLAKVGAALGGWDSLAWSGKGRGAILTDIDLFPPGSVTLNGIKLCGQLPMETAVSYAASLVRETGSGMEKPFVDMLRAQSGLFRRCTKVVCHEGGVTGVITGREVAVGSAAFMELLHIPLLQGLKVKNAVFCAVDGQLQAIFALNYHLHPAVRPSLDMLIAGGLSPILATRDFLVIPEMLRQRFKLSVDKMEFPSLDRRRDLSSTRQAHSPELTAVLCREGLGPYAEAVVAARRLASAAKVGTFFALLGGSLGLLLAAYLTAAQAFASLSAGALLLFLLLWAVPQFLISGWASRF